jgi:hypothetical protein
VPGRPPWSLSPAEGEPLERLGQRVRKLETAEDVFHQSFRAEEIGAPIGGDESGTPLPGAAAGLAARSDQGPRADVMRPAGDHMVRQKAAR